MNPAAGGKRTLIQKKRGKGRRRRAGEKSKKKKKKGEKGKNGGPMRLVRTGESSNCLGEGGEKRGDVNPAWPGA